MSQIIARWTNPTHDTDGNPYPQASHSHYEIQLNGGKAEALPLTWGESFDLTTLPSVQALPAGAHTATIYSVSTKGVKGKPVSGTFRIDPTPAALGNFSITQG